MENKEKAGTYYIQPFTGPHQDHIIMHGIKTPENQPNRDREVMQVLNHKACLCKCTKHSTKGKQIGYV